MTKFQNAVLKIITNQPGEDPYILSRDLDTTPQAFGRAAHVLMNNGLVYYCDSFKSYREWWPVCEPED